MIVVGGGMIYYDGQFNDSRLLIHMVATAFEQGGTLLNYVAATGLTKDTQGSVDVVIARDVETGAEMRFAAKAVINAAGAWADQVRRMAEDCVNQAATLAELPERACNTHHLNVHGLHPASAKFGVLAVYGTDAVELGKLMDANLSLAGQLHPELPYVKAEVVWAVRSELARTIEDVLARRTRALFLNARAAMEMAPAVADLMARELVWDNARKLQEVTAFRALAANYIVH